MTHPTQASVRKRPLGLVLSFLSGLFRLVIAFLRAVFFPRKPKKPIGYWARNEANRWELRVPAYGLGESSPDSR